MTATRTDTHVNFPPEFISPSMKESADYGLQYAKAIYSCGTRYGGRYYNEALTEFDDLTELAQGRASVDGLKNLFGYPTDINAIRDDATADLAYIDIEVLNLAPKYINRTVAKMQKLQYDISLQAIDLVSIEEKKDYAAGVQAYYRLKQWMADMKYDPKVLFPDLDVPSLPMFPDEMLFDIATNPKIKKEIAGELFMKLIHGINDFAQKMREIDWDLVVYGRAHVHCYADENGIPREDRIHPKFWGGSYVDNDNFEPQEYAYFYDFISVNQFIKETSEQMTQEQQMEVVAIHSNKNTHDTWVTQRRIDEYDGLGYIPVMRFYFRSEDNRNYVLKKTEHDRPYLEEKAHNYKPAKEVQEKVNTGEYRIVKNNYTSIYGGTWVIDSDCVYNYKRQNYPRQNLVNATIPIKTFATNFKDGRTVSFLSQMIEPMKMINIAWNGIKKILAEGRMGVMEIDFNQIEAVAMKSGGKVWTPQDVMRFFFKKNILIKRGAVNKYDQKTNDGIVMNAGGLQLADYMNSLQLGIQMLEQMTGASLIEQAQTPDRLAVKNAMLSQQTADLDVEYLFNGHEYLYSRTSHQLLLIGQGSLQSGKNINQFIPALGKVNSGYFSGTDDLAYCEYGMLLSRQPGPEEWADFYMNDLMIALKDGRIGPEDSAFIREIDNLKQARQILAIRSVIFQRKAAEAEARTMQLQKDMNSQSAAETLQNRITEIREQGKVDAELLKLEGMIKAKIQDDKEQWTSMNKRMEYQKKQQIAKQSSSDEIVKKAVENIPVKTKNLIDREQLEVDREALDVEREGLVVEREKVKATKNKPAAKKS